MQQLGAYIWETLTRELYNSSTTSSAESPLFNRWETSQFSFSRREKVYLDMHMHVYRLYVRKLATYTASSPLSRPVPAVTFPASRKWSGASPSPCGTGARLADARCPCYSVCGDPTLPSFSLAPRRRISHHVFYLTSVEPVASSSV